MRVPVPDGSVVDLVVELEKKVSIDDINKAVKNAADNELNGILEYSEVPLVSTVYFEQSAFKYIRCFVYSVTRRKSCKSSLLVRQ